MLAKIQTYINFGSLNPNPTWVFTYDNSISNIRVTNFSINLATLKLAILLQQVKTDVRFGFSNPKLLYVRIFANITIQLVLFLKYTEVPTTEFYLFSTNPELQIWQPCKNHGCHAKTDFIFEFYRTDTPALLYSQQNSTELSLHTKFFRRMLRNSCYQMFFRFMSMDV